MRGVTESVVEDAALAWLESLGYAVLYGPDMSPDGGTLTPALSQGERGSYSQVVLEGRLRTALARLNPKLPPEALEDAYRKLTRADAPSLIERNRAVHRMLVDGIQVEFRRKDGSIAGDQVRVIDFDDPDNNGFLAVNQFTVAEGQRVRRPDVVLFVNGLPLGVIELKNPADERATVWTAYRQLQTYQVECGVRPSFFGLSKTDEACQRLLPVSRDGEHPVASGVQRLSHGRKGRGRSGKVVRVNELSVKGNEKHRRHSRAEACLPVRTGTTRQVGTKGTGEVTPRVNRSRQIV